MATPSEDAEKGVRAGAARILRTADPQAKTGAALELARAWFAARQAGDALPLGTAAPPDHPARPGRPRLVDPREVPRRRPGTKAGRIALLHAIAHIELNAVDLHLDMVARFASPDLPAGFVDDWLRAAAEEARHFRLLEACLQARGSGYGALPAHAGMWRAAEDTAHDILARLAVVPMVLEARGLDVTPEMIAIFRKAGEEDAVAALEVIHREEVGHVAYGTKWFCFLCGREGRDPRDSFHALVRRHFRGRLKPPFDEARRAEAGLAPDFYWPLAEDGASPLIPPAFD